jgi:lipid-binding SYLF domain-containing protein
MYEINGMGFSNQGEICKSKRLKRFALACLCVGTLSAVLLYAEESATARLKMSAKVLAEIMATPDPVISQELIESAHRIMIVPGMKEAAVVMRGNYVRESMLCRLPSGSGGGPQPLV